MKYRKEIDGLRALAIVPVVLFHAGIHGFQGGFVGVDIFFVISGYLITSIILRDLKEQKFSLIQFYERRARRILPALFTITTICIPFAFFYLFPHDLKDFFKSILSIIFFSSNILFWRQLDYFQSEAELNPMLHTWSLSLEEQFYIFFPLLMMICWRYAKDKLIHALTLITCLSLALSIWGAENTPSASFFLLPFRAWELTMGALTAILMQRKPYKDLNPAGWLCAALSALGLFLILCSILIFNNKTPFPGFYALMPTTGTVLIILFANPQNLMGKLLSQSLCVQIGLISYSTYLWHQPLFAFARHHSLIKPPAYHMVLLAALSFILGYLSWRFVEQPFRQSAYFNRKQIFKYTAISSCFIIFISGYGYFFTKSYFSQNHNLTLIEEKIKINRGLAKNCAGILSPRPDCQTHSEPELLLWGDSYAMHLAQGLQVSEPSLKMVQMTLAVCGPFLDLAPLDKTYNPRWAKSCIEHNDMVLNYIKKQKSLKYVVLSSALNRYIDLDGKNHFLLRNGSKKNNPQVVVDAFNKTMHEIKNLGVQPVWIGPTPTFQDNIGHCLAKASRKKKDLKQCDTPFPSDNIVQQKIQAFLIKAEKTLPIIRLDSTLCPQNHCMAAKNELFIYRDQGHLSHEGSAWIGQEISLYKQISQKTATNPLLQHKTNTVK